MKRILLLTTFIMVFGLSGYCQSAKIRALSAEYDVVVNGQRGMNVKVTFDVSGMKGKTNQVALYFYYANGNRLEDTNGLYHTTDGQVSSHVSYTPQWLNTTYTDLKIFIPYDEFHLTAGKYQLKTNAYVWNGNTVLAKSDWLNFTYTKGQDNNTNYNNNNYTQTQISFPLDKELYFTNSHHNCGVSVKCYRDSFGDLMCQASKMSLQGISSSMNGLVLTQTLSDCWKFQSYKINFRYDMQTNPYTGMRTPTSAKQIKEANTYTVVTLSKDCKTLVYNGEVYNVRLTKADHQALCSRILAASTGGGTSMPSTTTSSGSHYEKVPSKHGYSKCKPCNGTGNCTGCRGTGISKWSNSTNPTTCPSCNGSGRCFNCYGTGQIRY